MTLLRQPRESKYTSRMECHAVRLIRLGAASDDDHRHGNFRYSGPPEKQVQLLAPAPDRMSWQSGTVIRV